MTRRQAVALAGAGAAALLCERKAYAVTNDFAWDFRATLAPAGFTSDPSYAVSELGPGSNDYVANRGNVNGVLLGYGWETGGASITSRNRGSSGIDPRIYGMNFAPNSATVCVFRVDLPASGQWDVSMALGDAAGNNPQNNYVKFNDGAVTTLHANTLSNQYADAVGGLWTTTTWPTTGSLVTVRLTFGSTIMRLTLGGTVDVNSSCLAHLRLTQVPTAGGGQTFVF